MDRSLITLFLALSAPLAAAAPVAPVPPSATAQPQVAAPAAPAPAALSPSAAAAPQALSPGAQAPLSATAGTDADEPVAPEEVEDPLALSSQATPTDLKPLSSTVLAKLAAALDPDQDAVWYDPDSGEAVPEANAGGGAARVDASALYSELAWRLARQEDKDARAALALATLKDPRAKEAKDLAFEDKLADRVIASLDQGGAKAKAELQALAAKGNRRARQYLGLDAPPSAPSAPSNPAAPAVASPVSPSTQTPAPSGLSPGAKP